MLSLPSGMAAHVQQSTTTLCNCILITRRDGHTFAFTDHDSDLVFEGITYKSKGGFSPSALESSSGLSVDNMEIEALIDDDSITEADLKTGMFSTADITIFLINYNNLANGEKIVLRKGKLGDITVKDRNIFVTEIRGMMDILQKRVGNVYAPACNVKRFGDNRCKLNAASFTGTYTVDALNSKRYFHATTGQADGVFNNGIVAWQSGANAGMEMEIKSFGSGWFFLQLPMDRTISLGEVFKATYGCDRTRAMCRDRYGNIVNYRGFPDIPGIDQILKVGT